MHTITNGPFKGIAVPPEQLQPALDENRQQRLRADGTPLMYWPAAHRTAVFLDKFSPLEGWALIVENEVGQFTLPDRAPAIDGSIVMQPTVRFTAKLLHKGELVASASNLTTIWGPKAWEGGETLARARLYDALGLMLPGVAGDPAPHPDAAAQPKVPQVTAVPLDAPEAPSTVVPVSAEAASLEEPAPAASDSASAEASATDTVAPAPSAPVAPVAIEQAASAPVVKIDANLMRTIQTQAAARGKPVPSFANVAEAKAFLKELLKPSATSGVAS